MQAYFIIFEPAFRPNHDKKSGVFDTSNKSYEPFQVDDGDVSAGCSGPNFTHFIVLSKYLFINTSPPRHSFLSPHEPHSSRGQIRCGSLAAVLLLNTCFRVVVNWYFVARALRGYRDSHHGPIEDICALAVVFRVLLWTTVSLSPVQVMVLGL